jgi:SAM-dependent methyltransferase
VRPDRFCEHLQLFLLAGVTVTALLYTGTLFLSATLLFVVQPLVGKQLLPVLGGTPAVWNACLLFFQAALLAGYFYSDSLQKLTARWQVVAHSAILVLALLLLFLREPLQADLGQIPTDSDFPTLRLLIVLALMVGLPFVALSATAPLLQSWFAATGARNPYFLYAASNVGSLLGLLGYPFLVEANFDLDQQRHFWAWGFLALCGVMLLCGLRIAFRQTTSPSDSEAVSQLPIQPLNKLAFLKWVLLAAIPSSWLLAVTSHLTTDIAPVPLFWVVPLALYLFSFVIVFAYWPRALRMIFSRGVPMLLMFLVIALLSEATEPLLLVAGIHLVSFIGIALLCHGELATSRPEPRHLTKFYLALSVGGVLGGLFNAVIAPVLFSKLGHLEYPLLIVLVCLIRPDVMTWSLRKRDALYLLIWGALTLALTLIVPRVIEAPTSPDDPDALLFRIIRVGLMLGLPVIGLFALVWNPIRFAIGVVLLLLISQLSPNQTGETLHIARNFFGTLKVTRSSDGQFTQLVHGTTQHGQQKIDEAENPTPRMYYYPTGPVGRLLKKLPPERRQRVGAVGLGCGAMAAYIEPGQQWTFFEIDPGVVRLAEDDRYFTFLKQAKAKPRIVLGDARRTLSQEPDGHFDLLVLDAFSSDAIPVHLLTQEAFAVYVRKLAPDGVLAFHLSNRYLNLPPLVARLGEGYATPFLMKLDEDMPSDKDRTDGKFASTWAVLYRDELHLGDAKKDIRFMKFPATPGPIWTDRFSNLLSVWK